MAVAAQRLAGPQPPAGSPDDVLDLIRHLGCLQLDPISVVARSPLLVLWSRLGVFDPAHLDALLWDERRLFEYWAHAASIVLTEDYPLHRPRMRRYLSGDSEWERRVKAWIDENDALRRYILRRLRRDGPLRSRDLEDRSSRGWRSTGWTHERNVDRMLAFMWIQGTVMVAGRVGLQRIWDLAERCLPDWTPRRALSERSVVREASQRSLKALGVATLRHIEGNFIVGRYPGLKDVVGELTRRGDVEEVTVVDDSAPAWPGTWFVHREDLPLLERIDAGDWQPRTTLLSPFDNLIRNRARTERLFGFDYRMEIYVPPAKRRYGYYVLPVLHGDRLIARIDPAMDRKRARLVVKAVHVEPGAPTTAGAARPVGDAVKSLASFLGANEIEYGDRMPDGWRRTLRA